MQLRTRISFFIFLAVALFAVAGISPMPVNPVTHVEEVAASWKSTEKLQSAGQDIHKIERGDNIQSESVHLQPQWRVQSVARVKEEAKTFLLSRYLSYLDDSFSLHTTTTYTRAVAFHITAYRFLLTFPKHWFW